MRIALVFLGLLCLCIAPLGAQAHNNGYFVVGASGGVHYVDMAGKVTSVTLTGSSIYATTMHLDNETALVYDYQKNTIFKVDPMTLAVVGTFFTSTLLTSTAHVYDMCFDHNGDFFFGSSGTGGVGRGVFKIDASSTLTPVTMATASTQPFYYSENIEIDIESAELLVADDSSTFSDQLNVLQRDGSAFKKVASGWNFRYGTHKDMNTGVIYSGTCCNSSTPNRTLYFLKPGTSTPGPFIASALFPGGYDPMLDRASMANPRIVCSAWSSGTAGGVWYVDLGTKAMVQNGVIPRNTYDLEFVFGRNLQTFRTAKGMWDIHVDVPGDAGKTYLLALSASGTRPGIGLPDGRRIPLAFDALSVVSITGGLTPFLTGHLGTLDKNGEATAKLNLNFLPASANGIAIWIGAVVMDQKAPMGLSTIVDTKAFKIEGL